MHNKVREPLFHIVKRDTLPWYQAWGIRAVAIVLALLLCLFAGVLAIYGYLRWLRNEKAMRLKQDLPYTRGLLIISVILLAVAGVVMVLVFYGG